MRRVTYHGQRQRRRYAPHRRTPWGLKSYGILIVAGVVGTLSGIGSTIDFAGWKASAAPRYDATISSCHAIDGDTLRCGEERIRLVGIDAPELPGHCRPGRMCAPGDPYAATSGLSDMVRSTMPIQRYGVDKYGRTIAALEGTQGDLSCAQLRDGNAIYKPQWDDRLHVARTCPGAMKV